jgi:hypothetical protein
MEVVLLVALHIVLAVPFTSKPNSGCEAESVGVLAEAAVEVAGARPVKAGAVEAASVAEAVVLSK